MSRVKSAFHPIAKYGVAQLYLIVLWREGPVDERQANPTERRTAVETRHVVAAVYRKQISQHTSQHKGRAESTAPSFSTGIPHPGQYLATVWMTARLGFSL
jgi:hypothetical protein